LFIYRVMRNGDWVEWVMGVKRGVNG